MCGGLEFHYLTAAGSEKVELKHQNVQTEPVETKDQLQAKAKLSMSLLRLHLWALLLFRSMSRYSLKCNLSVCSTHTGH